MWFCTYTIVSIQFSIVLLQQGSTFCSVPLCSSASTKRTNLRTERHNVHHALTFFTYTSRFNEFNKYANMFPNQLCATIGSLCPEGDSRKRFAISLIHSHLSMGQRNRNTTDVRKVEKLNEGNLLFCVAAS